MRPDPPPFWEDVPSPYAPGHPAASPHPLEPAKRRRRIRIRHVVLALLALFMVLVAWLAVTAPLSRSLQPIAAPSLVLLSAEGEPIARRGADIQAPVEIAKLPKHVPAAFVSIEDRGFYSHWGISVRGIARAAWRNLGAGGVREGGSTITQQLAKISFLSAKRTASRKAQEALIAFWLEAWLTKDQILERYLSNVYLGDNVYGLRAAAWHYFGHAPEKLTVQEAAMLAGMVKAPTRLAPTRDLAGARTRAKLVIAAMVREKAITQARANGLKPARLRVTANRRNLPTGTYFADWIMPAARAAGEEGYGEREVQTTLEARLQALAVRTVRRAGLGKAQVALVAMRPDGRVVAMVGGKDYSKSPFNRATQARRQPGSTFKLFVYLAAMRAGMSPDSTIEDRPLKIGDWQPGNSGGRYRGTLTLREAFALSSNVAAVRLQEQVGRKNVIRAARDLGITSPLSADPSLALGTAGVTLLEMTRAYAAVAAGAYPVKAQGLMEKPKPWYERIWSNYVARTHDGAFDEMKELLASVVTSGTGQGARLQLPTYGKTGTSQDNRDAIFIGFTDDLIVGVWVGNDDNSPLGQVAGGGLPARIWRDFASVAVGSQPVRPAAPPPVELPVESTGNISFSLPLGDSGVEVGVDIDGDSVDFRTRDIREPLEDAPPPPPGPDDALPPPEEEEAPPPAAF